MDGNSEYTQAEQVKVMPPSHSRILVIMAILGVAGTIAGAVFISPAFGIGILLGTGLAFVNYFWLKHSLQKVFDDAAADVGAKKPRISAFRYIFRYLTLAAIIALVFVTDVLPVVAVILGLGAFGFAVVVDGVIRIFQGAEAHTK